VIVARAVAAVHELHVAGSWMAGDTARLDDAFEHAARAALRAPALSERSLVLRRVAKRIVPERYRPAARQIVVRFDAASRVVVARGFRAIDLRRGR
jgi:hypothetical protein